MCTIVYTVLEQIVIVTTMCMVLSSWQNYCQSFPGSFDKCRIVPGGHRPLNQASQLPPHKQLQCLHSPSPFTATHLKADTHFTALQMVED